MSRDNSQNGDDGNHGNDNSHLPQSVRLRQRAVAEREASRLARPERPAAPKRLAHASKLKSAVSSTPFGFFDKPQQQQQQHNNNNNNSSDVSAAAVSSEEWCGPFSVARQMIAAREEARLQREQEQKEKQEAEEALNQHPLDLLLQQQEDEQKRKAHPSMNWQGDTNKTKSHYSYRDYYAKRRKRHEYQQHHGGGGGGGYNPKIKSLFQLCVDYLVANFEYVDSLGPIDGSIRNAICESLIAKGKFNGAAFEAIAEEGITSLEILDCADVTQEQLSSAFERLIPAGLSAIFLNHAGRCFGSRTVQTILSAAQAIEHSTAAATSSYFQKPSSSSSSLISSSPSLFALSIGGAYLLKDQDIAQLIQAYQTSLSSLEFKACPYLGMQFCTSIAHGFSAKTGGGILLELSLQDLTTISKESLLALASTDALRNLKNLQLQQISSLDDEVVHALLAATTTNTTTTNTTKKNTKTKKASTSSQVNNLEGINLNHNVKLTDAILSDIRSCNCNGQLRSLELAGLKYLTHHGLEAFFTLQLPGLPRAPMLRKLDLSECHIDSVTDTVLKFAATASSMKTTGVGVGVGVSGKADSSSETDKDGKVIRTTTAAAALSSMEHQEKVEQQINNAIITGSKAMGLSTMGGLVHLNISGSCVTDESMEVLAATCATSLEELNISFCSQISDKGLGYLVEQVNDQLRKIHIWGCAQLTDEFLDGHARADGSHGSGREPLQIVGAWMKKSGDGALR